MNEAEAQKDIRAGGAPAGEPFPRRFGPYVLLKPLARGGMGALYLGVQGQRGMEKLCVVKTALPHLVGKGYVQRFRDEASVVVRLSHGNLVAVFDAGQIRGEIFLAMDFVDGKDLRAVWNRCAQRGIAFPVDVAVHITKELVRGLGYVHAYKGLSLVHRDVSPPNVLLSYTGEVKLTDFGLAWSTLKLEKTAPGVIFGKVSYMAPEQARGESLDGRSDLYAAGIILWELLTGRQLFPHSPGGADDEVLEKVRQPVIVPPSQRTSRVPSELDRICLKALATDPAARYQSGEEMRADLAAFQAKTSPACDGDHVARFLRELFGDTIGNERSERERLVFDASALLRDDVKTEGTRKAFPGDGELPTPVHAAPSPRDKHDPLTTSSTTIGAHEPSRLVGKTVGGRYNIIRLIGEGGMGRVYEAEHVGIGKRVAVKVLHPAYTKTPDVVERFRREARAASKIMHPNVVMVTDSGTTGDNQFFFVMEYIEGIELGLALHREGPFAFDRMLKVALQVAEGVQAAHDAGIIHRDLKPENVLLIAREGQDEFVKVLDFGIAKSIEVEEEAKTGRRLTRPGVAMGTPEYMAPEQAAGKPADPRSDVYAVGSVMYEMLAGGPPFDGENVMEVLHKKANEAPRPLSELRPHIPAAIEGLVARAMARSPSQRTQTMNALAIEIRAVLAQLAPVSGALAPKRRNSPFVADALSAPGLPRPLFASVSRPKLAAASGGILMVFLAFLIVRATSGPAPRANPIEPRPVEAPVASAQPLAQPATVPTTVPTSPPAPAAAVPTSGSGGASDDPPGETLAPALRTARGVRPQAAAAGAGAESRQQLGTAWQLFNAQRFDDARKLFAQIADGRRAGRELRGSALLGLAKIAFQEQRYEEAARRARQGAASGGGIDAHITAGDSLYKMARFEDAHRAYSDALKLDPHSERARKGVAITDRELR